MVWVMMRRWVWVGCLLARMNDTVLSYWEVNYEIEKHDVGSFVVLFLAASHPKVVDAHGDGLYHP